MKTIVLARTLQDFLDWMAKSDRPPPTVIFGNDVRKFNNVKVEDIVILPGFWLRQDAAQLHSAAYSRALMS